MDKPFGYSWLIGGAQGSGIERGASVFINAIASAGYYVFGKREYYSNIMGEHSYYYVRFDKKPVFSHIEKYNILAAYDAETVFRHSLESLPESAIIFNSMHRNVRLSEIPTIEKRLRNDISKRLKIEPNKLTLQMILEEAEKNGVKIFPIDYNAILNEIFRKTGESLSDLTRMNNVIAVASSLALLKLDFDSFVKGVIKTFGSKKNVVELNRMAGELAYQQVESKGYANEFKIKLEKLGNKNKRYIINGNQAVAIGKILAGCRFQTYYPITPATDESNFLEAHENVELSDYAAQAINEEKEHLQSQGSIVVMETEDEIAAITMATGAALSGARASTSTSGPGFSLMVEGLGWAGMNEVPVVVTLYQRGGPSTGMPTRNEQGDLRFAIHAGHGEFPRIVLAPGDIEEAIYDTIRAFNYAERYQLPVILMLDKYLANSVKSVENLDLTKNKIDRGFILSENDILKLKQEGKEYKRFELTDNGISPRIFVGTKGAVFWNTGDEHDELGHITEDPVIRDKMMEKRMNKLITAYNEIPFDVKLNHFQAIKPAITLVSWGSNKGVILDLIEILKGEGIEVEFIQLRLLNPFPSNELKQVLEGKRWVDIENNYSAQLAGLIKENTGLAPDYYIVKYNGRPISLDELYIAVESILKGEAPIRQVLRGGT
jgi:Pyruvate:ferredoxin oxidoreductase and related 2-oxoacid:ferredoxin oxidoreductases, alpha subunit